MNDAIRMQISAFVDGELPHNEAELLLRRLCQDRDLRQQAAEYLAMGRAMRGEHVFTNMASLRERIAAELNDAGFADAAKDESPPAPRYLRPLAGFAIAAAVALVAILGLQQEAVDTGIGGQGTPIAVDAADDSYTVPDSQYDPLLDYARRHNASVQFFDTQLVAYPIPDEQSAGESGEDEGSTANESAEPTQNPVP